MSRLLFLQFLVLSCALSTLAQVTPPPATYIRSYVNDLPGQPLITVTLTVSSNVSCFTIEEQVPPAATALNVSGDGVWLPAIGAIRWGPYFNTTATNVSYRLTAPPGSYPVSGGCWMDGQTFLSPDNTVVVIPLAFPSPPSQVLTPQFTPGTGAPVPLSLTLTDATPGAAIYYTLDGSLPTLSSTPYTGPVSIAAATTVRAVAFTNGWTPSPAAVAYYGVAAPPSNAAVVRTVDTSTPIAPVVTLTVTPGATAACWAVTDWLPAGLAATSATAGGTYLASNNSVVWGPFFGTNPQMLTYQVVGQPGIYPVYATWSVDGVDAQGAATNIVVASTSGFPILSPPPQVISPTFTPPSGSPIPVSLNITDAVPGSAIFYTLDGSLPTPSSIPYAGAISITAPSTIRAVALTNGWTPSPAVVAFFGPAAAPANMQVARVVDTTVPTTPVVTLTLTPGTGAACETLVDILAPGLTPMDITSGGAYIASNNSVAWGPFFGTTPQVLSYQAVALPGTYPVHASWSVDGVSADGAATNIVVGYEFGFPSAPIQELLPVLSPPTASDLPVTVSISCADPLAQIYFTTDGSSPTLTSIPYSGPLLITAPSTLRARAFRTGYLPSDGVVGNYVGQAIPNSLALVRSVSGDATYLPSVNISATPLASVSCYSVTEAIVPGVVPSGLSADAVWDPTNGVIRWGPYLDNQPRVFHYAMTGPSGTYPLAGQGSFDGYSAAVTGVMLATINTVYAGPPTNVATCVSQPLTYNLAIDPAPGVIVVTSAAGTLDWGDGNQSVLTQPAMILQHNYATPGLYNLRATVAWTGHSPDAAVLGNAVKTDTATVGADCDAPVITAQPTDQIIFAGASARFSVTATSPFPMNYQWFYYQTNPVVEPSSATLILTGVQVPEAGLYSVVITNAFGSVTSRLASLQVVVPTCTYSLSSSSALFDSSGGVTNVLLSTPFGCDWNVVNTNAWITGINPTNGSGSNIISFVVTPDPSGQPRTGNLVIADQLYTVSQQGATLAPPSITSQPTNETVVAGAAAGFQVAASGSGPLVYQWWFNGTNLLAGATNANLVLANAQIGSAGGYFVTVTNPVGSVSSVVANLTVLTPPVVLITQPADGATFAGGNNITITVTAQDAVGVVTNVAILANATNLLGNLSNAPYSLVWSNVPSGAYSLTAQASDSYSLSGASPPVAILVSAPLVGLTVSGITAANKTYDGTTTATINTTGATLNGVLAADVGKVTLATGAANGTFADRNVGTAKSVTISGLSLSGSAAANYTLIQPTTAANITPRTLAVAGITAANKTYDGTIAATLSASGAALNGVLPVDAGNVALVTSGAAGVFADPNVGPGKMVTITGLTLTGSAAANYSLAQPTATASITAGGILTVTGITAANKTYDGTTAVTLSTSGATLNGVSTADVGKVTLTTSGAIGTFADKNAATAKTVTITGLALSGSAAGNYTLTQPSTTANITPAALTVTGITVANKTYDGTTAATLNTSGATLNGVLSADAGNVVLVTSGASGSFADRNVGTAKTVTITGLALSGSAATNYTLTQPTAAASITPANLTVTGITAANKTYDGTTTATLNASAATLNGILPLDAGQVSLVTSGAIGVFADPNVGAGKTVSITGLALTGSAAGNYSLTQPPATASITAGDILTVTGITAANKTYDGTTTATINTVGATLNGLLAADVGKVTLVTSGATGTFADKNVGTGKPVTITGLALSGSAAANYTLTQPSTTANITPAALTVTGITAANKTYDGTTAATLNTSGATLNGVLSADAGNVALVTTSAVGSFADLNVGTGKTVTITGLTLTGSAAGNYSITPPSATASITAASSLTVTGITAANKVYDGSTTATINTSGATLNGMLAADSGKVTLVTSAATGTFADKNVGTGKPVSITGLALSGSAAGNYTLTQPTTTASITPLGLTVAGITVANKTYDGTTSAKLNTSSAALIGVLSADMGNVALVTSGATGTFADKNVGVGKAVTLSGLTLSGSAAANYSLTQASTTANIAALGLTVTGITGANKTYDGTTPATLNASAATLNGVLPVDAGQVSLVTGGAIGVFADPNVGTAKTVTITGLSLTGSAAGNYSLTQPTATASITAGASLTVTGITAANKVYDGTTTATPNTSGATLNGVLAADVGRVALVTSGATGAFADKNVGTAKTVTITGLTLSGSAAGNYTLSSPTPTASITPAALTVTGITAASKTYDGSTAATLNTTGATLKGVLSVDVGNVVLVTSGATGTFADSAIGPNKLVTITGLTLTGSAAGNYSLTQPTATASITVANALTVTGITAANKVYDGTTAATISLIGATLHGVSPADVGKVTLVTGAAIGVFADRNVGAAKTVTISGLTLSGSAAGNYTLIQPTTTADITPRTATVTGLTAANKVYDGTTAAALVAGGAILNRVLSVDTGNVKLLTATAIGTFADKNVGTGKVVTISGLALSGTAAANYTLIQPTATASITPAPLTVKANDATRSYGDANPAFTATLSGFVNGETQALVVNGSPGFSVTATATSSVGTYAIVPALGTLNAQNYSFGPFVNGTITVVPASLVVSADNQSRSYGTPNPVFTGSLVGVRDGDAISAAYNCSASVNSPPGTYPIIPSLLDPGGRLVNYRVTANNGTLTVTGAVAPTVQITVPTDRTIFVTNELIQIEAAVADPQHLVQRVEFYANGQPGQQLLGVATGAPYRLLWSGAALGRYDLVAQTVDQQGNKVSSTPVAIVVSDACGRAAIVRNTAGPEIDKLQDYLFEVGVSGQVFDHGSVTADQLQPFRVVVWDDLGAPGLTDGDVTLFGQLLHGGMGLYFIGDDLVGSAAGLSAAAQTNWLSLVHLQPSGSTAAAGPVTLDQTSPYPLVKGGMAGTVADFNDGAIPQPGVADGANFVSVLGQQDGRDVLLVYDDQGSQARSVTQTFGVTGGTDAASLAGRQTLFENTVRWLLRCDFCSDVGVQVDVAAADSVALGADLEYGITATSPGGECDPLQVVVTDVLPAGAQFLSAASTNGVWSYADGIVKFHLDQLNRNGGAAMVIRVLATQAGVWTNDCAVSASNSPRSAEMETVTQVTANQPLLSISASPGTPATVSITGPTGRTCVLEASTDLRAWSPVWTNVLAGAAIRWQEPQPFAARQRFFRARLAP